MESLFDSRISQHFRQDVTNAFFPAPSPVPVRRSPSQGQQDHSLGSPHTEYGNSKGQPEELVQCESAIPSFLSSLRFTGIALPPGIELVARKTSARPEDPGFHDLLLVVFLSYYLYLFYHCKLSD